jgi:hypothetical protein
MSFQETVSVALAQRPAARAWATRLELAVLTVLGLVLLGACVLSFVAEGGLSYQWDWLFLSGLGLFLGGAVAARRLPARLQVALTRLTDRGVLVAQPDQLVALEALLADRATTWAHRAGLVVVGLLVVATMLARGIGDPGRWGGLVLVEVLAGYTAGRSLGRMAAYGSLGTLLGRLQLPLRVRPGHLDGAAGLKPVGDLYFFQALLAALPALFLAAWWVLIPVWPVSWYARWREPYLALLAPAILFEVLAFLVPMWWFHTRMVDQKRDLLREADILSAQLDRTATLVSAPTAPSPPEVPADRVAALTQAYWDVERMPTWPVDVRTWRRFALNNLALVLPLLSRAVGADSLLGRVFEVFGGMLRQPSA